MRCFTSGVESGSSSGRSSNFLCRCEGDGGSSLIGGGRSGDSVASVVIGATAGGGAGEPGTRSGCSLMGGSRLGSCLLGEGVGDSGGVCLSGTGEGGASVGATSCLTSGGELGGSIC